MAAPPSAAFSQVLSQCGLDASDFTQIDIFHGSTILSVDDTIEQFQDSQICVRNKTGTQQEEGEGGFLVQVIKPSGITVFLRCEHDVTIRQRLLDAAFPIAFVDQLRATQDGKMISMDTTIGQCSDAAIRLRMFPLKGGGGANPKAKENKILCRSVIPGRPNRSRLPRRV